MRAIVVDGKTYDRIEKFAQEAGISVQAAARDAVENWLDIVSDPRLAVATLNAIAMTEPDVRAGADSNLPRNVVHINEWRERRVRPEFGTLRRPGEPWHKEVLR
jgi:hypothetical protein